MTESQTVVEIRENQLAAIKEELKLSRNFFVEYDSGEDTILVGNKLLVLTLKNTHLDRDDYMDVVKYSYGRFMEALDHTLMNMKVMGHA